MNSDQANVTEVIIVMVNSSLLMMAISNLPRNGFLILVAGFICVSIWTGF